MSNKSYTNILANFNTGILKPNYKMYFILNIFASLLLLFQFSSETGYILAFLPPGSRSAFSIRIPMQAVSRNTDPCRFGSKKRCIQYTGTQRALKLQLFSTELKYREKGSVFIKMLTAVNKQIIMLKKPLTYINKSFTSVKYRYNQIFKTYSNGSIQGRDIHNITNITISVNNLSILRCNITLIKHTKKYYFKQQCQCVTNNCECVYEFTRPRKPCQLSPLPLFKTSLAVCTTTTHSQVQQHLLTLRSADSSHSSPTYISHGQG